MRIAVNSLVNHKWGVMMAALTIIAVIVAIILATGGSSAESKNVEQSESLGSERISILDDGQRAELSSDVKSMAQSSNLKKLGLKVDEARSLSGSATGWSIVPAANGGACLIAPRDGAGSGASCVGAEHLKRGLLQALIITPDQSRSVVGVVSDDIVSVRVTGAKGRSVGADVKNNSYKIDYTEVAAGGAPTSFEFITKDNRVVPLVPIPYRPSK